jgi:NTP pyrophosphatase (non-canonical NTP hydrolase)
MTNNNKKEPSPFGRYYRSLESIDQEWQNQKEYGSFLILSLVEEVGEMARAYMAKHGRKKRNLAAQNDETYEQELGDILVSILRFARIKNIDLDSRIRYSITKIKRRLHEPKRSTNHFTSNPKQSLDDHKS